MGDLHDVSTPSGALTRFLFRWKHVAWALLAATAVLIIFANLANVYSMNSFPLSSTQKAAVPTTELSPKHAVPLLGQKAPQGTPESTFVVSGSKLMYYGNEKKFEERNFDDFPGLPNVSQPIDTIEIKWSRVNGSKLTSALKEFYPSLKSLHLENVTLEGSLEPVFLGSLEEFSLVQSMEAEEWTDAPIFSLGLIEEELLWLHSTLFFLNDSKSDFPSKVAGAYRRGINVTVHLRGSLVYQLNPKGKDVRLAISNCSEILDELRNDYTSVVLARCRDLRNDSISTSTASLDFYIVENMSSDLLAEILQNLPNLELFAAEIPSRSEVLEVDLSAFGRKIRVIAISSMDIKVPSSGLSVPSVREFYLGAENTYSWLPSRETTLNVTFFSNFPELFPSVERVGLFDLRNERRYESLEKVMRTPSVVWLLVQNFLRIANTNETIPMEDYESPSSVASVEAELSGLGLEETEESFLLTGGGGGGGGGAQRVGRSLTTEEKLWYRYKYLGWRPIDSWAKYLSVQRKIAAGWLL